MCFPFGVLKFQQSYVVASALLRPINIAEYAAVIIKRYAEAAGDAKDVFVEREGEVFSLQEALAGLNGGQAKP